MKGIQIKETLSFRHRNYTEIHGLIFIFLPPCFPRNPCLKYQNAVTSVLPPLHRRGSPNLFMFYKAVSTGLEFQNYPPVATGQLLHTTTAAA